MAKKISPWILWTFVGLLLCSSISYISYRTIYTPVMNWLGFPARAQTDDFFIFAEKIGYQPQNQLAFNQRACNGLFAESCKMILIFETDQSISHSITNSANQLRINQSNNGTSRVRNLIGGFRDAYVDLLLDGKDSLAVPSPPSFPHTSWYIYDSETNQEWVISVYQIEDYPHSVEINGKPQLEDFIYMSKHIK